MFPDTWSNVSIIFHSNIHVLLLNNNYVPGIKVGAGIQQWAKQAWLLPSWLLNYLDLEEMAELEHDKYSNSVKSSESGHESLWKVRRNRRGSKEGGRERHIQRDRENLRKRKLGLRCEVTLMRTSKRNGSTVRKYN